MNNESLQRLMDDAKKIYDLEVHGGPTKRVQIYYEDGNKIGFDKRDDVSIEDALIALGNMIKNSDNLVKDIDEWVKK